MMKKQLKSYNTIGGIVMFVGLPLLFWAVGDSPQRSVLKEVLSLLTLLSFSLMLAQFYLSRSGKTILKVHKMTSVHKLHKIIGYVFVSVLLLHPFLIVLPRYFEAGIEPADAFLLLITTFETKGVILGMIAWGLMLVIGLSSLFRDRLPMKYTTWRLWHGILSVAFVTIATWHAIDLGSHADKNLSIFLIILAGGGILLLLRTYFPKPLFKRKTIAKDATA